MASDALTVLKSGAAEIVPESGLEEKFALGRPLRVKLGLDPTAEHVTLGWAVVLRKLRQFQDAGHVAVLIVGDFTARVGDPSGQSETRPRLSKKTVDHFSSSLLKQFKLILSDDNLEVRHNSEWLSRKQMPFLLRLTSSYTVAKMLQRDDFALRLEEHRPISIMELLYPLLQAYDSIAVGADIELGGSDQLFNLLVGRDLQKSWGHEPQVALTMPLLEGLDGVNKMSQSQGNYVAITDDPQTMFGKLMRIPDELIVKYLQLCTDLDPADVDEIARGLTDGSRHPAEEKRRLAREVVNLYSGPGSGANAEEAFNRVHRDREVPADVRDVYIPASTVEQGTISIPAVLEAMGLVNSRSEARRLMRHGGVRVNGGKVESEELVWRDQMIGQVWQVGRRKFARLAGFLPD